MRAAPVLACLAVLALTSHVEGTPLRAEPVPAALDSFSAAMPDRPGTSCAEKALAEHRLVLTDAANRADHHYLAHTYEAMAEHRLEC